MEGRFEGPGRTNPRVRAAPLINPVGGANADEMKPLIDHGKDRVFPGESITNDVAFTIHAVIVVDPQLPKAAEEAPAAETPAEGQLPS